MELYDRALALYIFHPVEVLCGGVVVFLFFPLDLCYLVSSLSTAA